MCQIFDSIGDKTWNSRSQQKLGILFDYIKKLQAKNWISGGISSEKLKLGCFLDQNFF